MRCLFPFEFSTTFGTTFGTTKSHPLRLPWGKEGKQMQRKKQPLFLQTAVLEATSGYGLVPNVIPNIVPNTKVRMTSYVWRLCGRLWTSAANEVYEPSSASMDSRVVSTKSPGLRRPGRFEILTVTVPSDYDIVHIPSGPLLQRPKSVHGHCSHFKHTWDVHAAI